MNNMLALATDLLCKAKISPEIASKINNLEQVQEIVFHRDVKLLPLLFPEILEFMLEKSAPLRRFLLHFVFTALKNGDDFISQTLPVLSFVAMDPSQESPLKIIASELALNYDKFVMYIVNSKASDSKDLMNHLKTTTKCIIDSISSKKSDSYRSQCIKLAESIIVFGTPIASNIFNESKANAKYDIMNIPFHHPSIDRNALELEAESLFTRLLLWARRGGPQESPFSLLLMSQLLGAISKIAIEKPTMRGKAAQALSYLLDELPIRYNTDIHKDFRATVLYVSNEMINSCASTKALDASMMKLRDSFSRAKQIFPHLKISLLTPVTLKRQFSSDSTTDGDNEQELKRRREDAIAAVDLAESLLQQQQQSSSTITPPTTASTKASVDGIELASDLISFPIPSANIKLVELVDGPSQTSDSFLMHTAGNVAELTLKAYSNFPSDTYGEMALQGLYRLVEDLAVARHKKKNANLVTEFMVCSNNNSCYKFLNILLVMLQGDCRVRIILCVRLAVALALIDIESGNPLLSVPIMLSFPHWKKEALSHIPSSVALPK